MPRFFKEYFKDAPFIDGDDARHIIRSLRMRIGETLTVCDTMGTDYLCEIAETEENLVRLNVLEEIENRTEPTVKVTLFQCNPKGDKLDMVVQKAVELGISEIVPVLSEHCVSRPDGKSAGKKRERMQKIADEAAKQSGRGKLPTIGEFISFKECCKRLDDFDKSILFYELGGKPIAEIVNEDIKSIAIVIGPEGGFSKAEVESAKENGAEIATLGPRILRTETAPLAAITAIMLLTNNLN